MIDDNANIGEDESINDGFNTVISDEVESDTKYFSGITGMSYYDNILKNKNYFYWSKNIKFSIVEMSPDQYLIDSAKIHDTSVDVDTMHIRQSDVNELAELMQSGIKMDMPVLQWSPSKDQEGRHRALASKQIGIDKIPVMVVNEVREHEIKRKLTEIYYEAKKYISDPSLMAQYFKDKGVTLNYQYQILPIIEENTFGEGGLIAPNGETSNLTPEQYKLVRTPAFKKWFGDFENDPENSSKVVDENGEPLVVFHGSKKSDFTVFNTKEGSKTKSKMQLDFGSHFTSKEYALFYKKEKGKLFECFLNIRNPLNFTNNNSFKYLGDKDFEKFLSLMVQIDKPLRKDLYYDANGNKKDEIQYAFLTANILDKVSPQKARTLIIESGFDGIIYEPYHPQGNYYTKQDLSFIALLPEQIKLADGTNTTFDSSNPDIRFDKGGLVSDDDYKETKHVSEDGNMIENKIEFMLDDEAIGVLDYIYEKSAFSPVTKDIYKSELYINYIEVIPEYQNKGVGVFLLRRAIEDAIKLGVEVVTLKRDSGMGCAYGSVHDNYLKKIYAGIGFVDSWTQEQVEQDDELNICGMHLDLRGRKQFAGGGNVADDISKRVNALELSAKYESDPVKKNEILNKIKSFDNSVLLAPNGKPSLLPSDLYKLVRGKSFIAWFGDWLNDPANASKVIDENGEPLIVWHGTLTRFTIFDYYNFNDIGFHFGTKTAADHIVKGRLRIIKEIDPYTSVAPYFLNIRNAVTTPDLQGDEVLTEWIEVPKYIKEIPKDVWLSWDKEGYGKFNSYDSVDLSFAMARFFREKMRDYGIDGVKYINENEDKGSVSYIAFFPNQIKLADGTNKTFDASNSDIRFDKGGCS